MNRLLPCLLALAVPGCAASTGAVPRPFPAPGGSNTPTVVPPAVTGPASGYAIAGTALSMRGVPYRNGGADPSGFDCSGLVAYVFARHGLRLPRSVSDQYKAGTSVSGHLEPGDLVFFTTTGPGASHVGISLGGDEFVHAPSSSGEVRVERLGASYWAPRYVGARRVI